MKNIIPALVCWLYALWWLITGVHDFGIMVYATPGSERYRTLAPLLLRLVASVDLGLLGYFTLTSNRKFIVPLVVVFALIWMAWGLVANRLHGNRKY